MWGGGRGGQHVLAMLKGGGGGAQQVLDPRFSHFVDTPLPLIKDRSLTDSSLFFRPATCAVSLLSSYTVHQVPPSHHQHPLQRRPQSCSHSPPQIISPLSRHNDLRPTLQPPQRLPPLLRQRGAFAATLLAAQLTHNAPAASTAL